MVRQCCIENCKSEFTAGGSVSFHRLPIREVLQQKWLEAIPHPLENIKGAVVCSIHFGPDDYYQRKKERKLKEEAVPSIFQVSPGTEQAQSPAVKTQTHKNDPRVAEAPQLASSSHVPSSRSHLRGTQLPCEPITVTSGPSLQFQVSLPSDPPPAFPQPMMVELKNEEDPIEPYEVLPSEGVVSFDENLLAFQSYNDQTTEELVPLSAHPVPLSNAPDPLSNELDLLCDFKVKKEEENGTEEKENGAGVAENGTVAEVDETVLGLDGTMLELDGTMLELDGTVLELDGMTLEVAGTVKEETETVQVNPMGVNSVGVNPAGVNPAGVNPVGVNPVGVNPVGVHPVGVHPVGVNPVGVHPVGVHPVGVNPVGVNPVELIRLVDGQPMPVVLPAMANLVQARAYEQKIKNLTRRCEQFGIKVRNLGKLVRRREAKINELQSQLETLCDFVREHHGGNIVEDITGGGDTISKQSYREMIKRRDDMIAALQNEVDSLKNGGKGNDENLNGGSVVTPRIRIHSVERDEQKKKSNRQLVTVTRDERRKTSVCRRKKAQSTSDIQPKSSLKADILQKSLVGILDTSDILQNTFDAAKKTSDTGKKKPSRSQKSVRSQKSARPQKSVITKPKIVLQKNLPVVFQSMPDISQNPSVSVQLKQKSSPVQGTSVPLIGNKRKSDIRQNPAVVIHPKLDIRQKSPDIPQTSVDIQRTSDVRQNALVIQIDGMHSTVLQPKLVRLEDNNMDLG